MTVPTSSTAGPVEPERRRGFSPTEVVLGLILVFVGIIWLLRSTDIVDVSWYVVLSVALVVVGIALVIGSVAGEQSGLISVGVILTVLLMLGSWGGVNFEGGVGDRTFAPASIEDLESSYGIIAGNLTLDLSNIDFPEGETVVEARVGAGEVLVTVPEGVAVSVEWNVLAGDVLVFGVKHEGVLLDDSQASPGFASAPQRLVLDLRVLAGSIEVHQ